MTNMFDVNSVRDDFPILKQLVNGSPLVYLDNGATSQKPQPVIDAIVEYYTTMKERVPRLGDSLMLAKTRKSYSPETRLRALI